jgi:hypothetical protein
MIAAPPGGQISGLVVLLIAQLQNLKLQQRQWFQVHISMLMMHKGSFAYLNPYIMSEPIVPVILMQNEAVVTAHKSCELVECQVAALCNRLNWFQVHNSMVVMHYGDYNWYHPQQK